MPFPVLPARSTPRLSGLKSSVPSSPVTWPSVLWVWSVQCQSTCSVMQTVLNVTSKIRHRAPWPCRGRPAEPSAHRDRMESWLGLSPDHIRFGTRNAHENATGKAGDTWEGRGHRATDVGRVWETRAVAPRLPGPRWAWAGRERAQAQLALTCTAPRGKATAQRPRSAPPGEPRLSHGLTWRCQGHTGCSPRSTRAFCPRPLCPRARTQQAGAARRPPPPSQRALGLRFPCWSAASAPAGPSQSPGRHSLGRPCERLAQRGGEGPTPRLFWESLGRAWGAGVEEKLSPGSPQYKARARLSAANLTFLSTIPDIFKDPFCSGGSRHGEHPCFS